MSKADDSPQLYNLLTQNAFMPTLYLLADGKCGSRRHTRRLRPTPHANLSHPAAHAAAVAILRSAPLR